MARIKTECSHPEEIIALLEAAEEAQNVAKMCSNEVSLPKEGPQGRKASELTEKSDEACPLVTENKKMKSKKGSSGASEPHLRAGAEAEASAFASGEDAEVKMRPMVVLKKAQQSKRRAKVRRATSTGQKVMRRKHRARVVHRSIQWRRRLSAQKKLLGQCNGKLKRQRIGAQTKGHSVCHHGIKMSSKKPCARSADVGIAICPIAIDRAKLSYYPEVLSSVLVNWVAKGQDWEGS
ncbi:unnamed protein product [Ixodes pacificus]